MKFLLCVIALIIIVSQYEVQAATCSVTLQFSSESRTIQYSVNGQAPQDEGTSSFTFDDSLASTPLTFTNAANTGFNDLVFTITDANGNVLESNVSCPTPSVCIPDVPGVTIGDIGIAKGGGESIGQTKSSSKSLVGKKALACTISSSNCSQIVFALDFVCPEPVGAGGDPHIFAPSLPHAFELASYIKENVDSFQKKERAVTNSPETQASATLVDTDSLTMVGLIAENKFSTKGRTYFTTMQISSKGKFFSFEPNNTVKDDNVQLISDLGTIKCVYGQEQQEYSITMNSEYYLMLRCNDVVEQAKRNDLVANEFSWHSKYSVASMTIHRTLDDSKAIEMFYIQEERRPQTGLWSSQPFGYIDISINGFSDSIEGILGKSQQNNFARAVTEDEILDFVSQYVVVY